MLFCSLVWHIIIITVLFCSSQWRHLLPVVVAVPSPAGCGVLLPTYAANIKDKSDITILSSKATQSDIRILSSKATQSDIKILSSKTTQSISVFTPELSKPQMQRLYCYDTEVLQCVCT